MQCADKSEQVPQDKPSEAVDMMTRWLRGETFA